MRSTSLPSFAVRSALLAFGATLGAAACSDAPPDITNVNVGGSNPCPDGCEDTTSAVVTTFESSSTASGFVMCTAEEASQHCNDNDPCTKDLCLFGTCAHVPSSACSGPGALVFAEGYAISDAPRDIRVAAGPDGTTVTAALFTSNIILTEGPIGSSGRSVLVQKLDAGGQSLWTRVFKGAGGVDTVAVAVDSAGSVLLAGSFLDGPQQALDFGGLPLGMVSSNETTFVAKLDAKGEHVWSKAIPSSLGSAAQSVAVDAKGTLAVSGWMNDTLDFGGGPVGGAGHNPTFVAALDTDGQALWSRAFTDDSPAPSAVGHRLAFTPSGDLVVAGSFLGKADVGSGPIGTTGVQGAFVTELDPLGATVWSDVYLSPSSIEPVAVQGAAVNDKGAIFISGAFATTVDFGAGPLSTTGADDRDLFVLGLGPDGKTIWSRAFGDTAHQSYCTVAAGAAGKVAIAGGFSGSLELGTSKLGTTSKDDMDVFVGALDDQGNPLWGRRFGNGASQLALSLALDPQGNFAVAGAYLGPIDFGAGPLKPSDPITGYFVAKLAP